MAGAGRDPAPTRFALDDPRPAIRELSGDLRDGVDVPTVAARFHRGVAAATVDALAAIAGRRGLEAAVLSGGVFQNRMLLRGRRRGARAAGLRVLVPAGAAAQ